MSQKLAELFVDIVARDKTGQTFRHVQSAMSSTASQANSLARTMTAAMSTASSNRASHAAMLSGMSAAGHLAANRFGNYPATGGSSTVSAMMQLLSGGSSSGLITGMSAAGKTKQQELESLEQARGMRRSHALREELAMIQNIVSKRRLSLDAAGTPQGLALARQMNQMGQVEAWRRAMLERGPISGALSQLSERLAPLQRIASLGLGTGLMAIGGLTAAASPQLWDTLTGSLRLLASEVGRGLIPGVVDLTRWIQSVSFWYRELDDSTKLTVGRVILYGTALAGGVATLGIFLRAVDYASYALFRLGLSAPASTATTVATTAVASAAATQAANNAAATGGTAVAVTMLARAIPLLAAAYGAYELYNFVQNPAGPGAGADAHLGMPFGPAVGGTMNPAFSQSNQQNHPFLTNYRFQPQMGGIEDVWRNVQMSALGQTPLEQRIMMNQLEALQEIAVNTNPNNNAATGMALAPAGGAS